MHVQRADARGNAHLWGIIGEQKEAAFAAKHVIVTAEEIVDEAVIRSDPNRTLIPEFIVDAVCHVPYAPTLLTRRAIMTATMIFTWNGIRSASRAEALRAYLDEWVYGVADRARLLGKAGRRSPRPA